MLTGLRASLRVYRQHVVAAAVLRVVGILGATSGVAAAAAVASATRGGSTVLAMTPVLVTAAGMLAALAVAMREGRAVLGASPTLARRVEALLPELGDRVQAAVGLSTASGAMGASPALVQAHVKATQALLSERAYRQRHLQTAMHPTRGFVAAGAVGLVILMLCHQLAEDRLTAGFRRAFAVSWMPPKEGAAALPPLWSNVSVTLRYPAYMKRADQHLEGVSGDLTAPRGTEVELRAHADRALRSARLVFSSGDVFLSVHGTRELEGRFTVQHTGRYRLALVDSSGDEVIEQDYPELARARAGMQPKPVLAWIPMAPYVNFLA
jgi:hypothetical protein